MNKAESPTLQSFASHLFKDVIGYGALAASSVAHLGCLRSPVVRRILYKQIYFTGIEALFPVSMAGLLVGLAVISQMSEVLGSGVALNVRAIKLLVVRELGTLLTALIVLARSGSAVASELASMKQRGEIRALYLMGIDPEDYLIVPRVLGVCISVFVLTFYFQFMATIGGMVVASAIYQVSFVNYIAAFSAALDWNAVLVSMAKSILYGGIIASVCCHHGIYAGHAAAMIPRSTETAMIRTLGLLFLTDAAFAILTV